MKFLILALFVAAVSTAPIDEDSNGPVELILNGVPEGQPIDLSDIVDIKVKEHVNGQVASATNLLHPFTAEGIAEAIAAEVVVPEPVVLPAPVTPEVAPVVPKPAVLPAPVAPEFVPSPISLPSPVAPEVAGDAIAYDLGSIMKPQPIVMPAPVAPEVVGVVAEPVVLPSPVAPEVAEVVPAPASIPSGEIFNDSTVSVTLNTPQEVGVLSSIQSWFSMVLNYFNDGAQTSHQIV